MLTNSLLTGAKRISLFVTSLAILWLTNPLQSQTPLSICSDPEACNYNANVSNSDASTCIYPLVPGDCLGGAQACGEGQYWNPYTQKCVTIALNACPADLTGDGDVNVADLLNFLADFGTSCGSGGCTDPWASNYSAEATFNDGTCQFGNSGISFEFPNLDDVYPSCYGLTSLQLLEEEGWPYDPPVVTTIPFEDECGGYMEILEYEYQDSFWGDILTFTDTVRFVDEVPPLIFIEGFEDVVHVSEFIGNVDAVCSWPYTSLPAGYGDDLPFAYFAADDCDPEPQVEVYYIINQPEWESCQSIQMDVDWTVVATDACGNVQVEEFTQVMMLHLDLPPLEGLEAEDCASGINAVEGFIDNWHQVANCYGFDIEAHYDLLPSADCSASNYEVSLVCGSHAQTFTLEVEHPATLEILPSEEPYVIPCGEYAWEEGFINSLTVVTECGNVVGDVGFFLDYMNLEATSPESTPVTVAAIDECGNTAFRTITVAGLDIQGPEFAVLPQDLVLSCGDSYDVVLDWAENHGFAQVYDVGHDVLGCGPPMVTSVLDPIESGCALGVSGILEVSAEDFWGNVSTVTANYYVIDDVPPTIVLDGGLQDGDTYELPCGADVLSPIFNAVAFDNCTEEVDVILDILELGPNQAVHQYFAVDGCDNANSVSIVVQAGALVTESWSAILTGQGGDAMAISVPAEGNLVRLNVDVDFVGGLDPSVGAESYAGDLVLVIGAPNGACVKVTAFPTGPCPISEGTWPESAQSGEDQSFSVSIDLTEYGLGGQGEWDITLEHGWAPGDVAEWSLLGSLELCNSPGTGN